MSKRRSATPSETELVASARRKLAAGGRPNQQEARALKRAQKAGEEQLRWQYYKSIPQKHWCEMSGRQPRTINEQAQTYGIPFAGATIDLPAVAKALHDFLAKHKHRFNEEMDAEAGLLGENSPALEKWRQEKYLLARLDRMEREKTLLPRDRIHDGLAQLASMLRAAGETLRKEFGPSAQATLDETLDDFDRLLAELFTADDDSDSPPADAASDTPGGG